MAAHSELLRDNLRQHFLDASAFITAVSKSGEMPKLQDANISEIKLKIPDFGRAFIDCRTLAQLYDRLHQADSRLQMDRLHAEAVDLLMDAARACHHAALVSLQRGDSPAAARSLKFIKALAVCLRDAESPAFNMPDSCIVQRLDELNLMTTVDMSANHSEVAS
jgi:hypothetical protein